jgi:hypothetical protein
MILPVDPMAWGMRREWVNHDVLLSISELGELAFWVPDESSPQWRCSGSVKTHRGGISRARCSSAKMTALSNDPFVNLLLQRWLMCRSLVMATPEGDELTIWDSKESEFASGLEFRGIYRFFFFSSHPSKHSNLSPVIPSMTSTGPRLQIHSQFWLWVSCITWSCCANNDRLISTKVLAGPGAGKSRSDRLLLHPPPSSPTYSSLTGLSLIR